jgi:hypothetical protein
MRTNCIVKLSKLQIYELNTLVQKETSDHVEGKPPPLDNKSCLWQTAQICNSQPQRAGMYISQHATASYCMQRDANSARPVRLVLTILLFVRRNCRDVHYSP